MLNRLFRIALFLLCTFFLSPIFSQTLDEENPVISWDPIPNASSYQLQIRNEAEEILLEEDLEDTSYKLNLEPGKYSHRVGAYNKFKKISSYSEWFPFIIAQILAPQVTSEQIVISSKKLSEQKISIKGKYFYKNTLVTLKNETGTLPITNLKLNKDSIEFVINQQNAKAGNYDLILENPRKKILVIKNYYQLKSENIFTANVDSSTYPYWKEALRSAILPGWGQARKNQLLSGIFLDILLLASAGYYKSRLDAFNTEKSKYDQAVLMGALYQELKIPSGGMYGVFSSESQFQKVESTASTVGPASILIGAIYAINILDALLWKASIVSSKKEVSFHFYTKFQMTSANNSNLPFNPNSNNSQLEFGLRFSF